MSSRRRERVCFDKRGGPEGLRLSYLKFEDRNYLVLNPPCATGNTALERAGFALYGARC